jgi:RNA polymerase sigma-70 factor (ECF subfamily)
MLSSDKMLERTVERLMKDYGNDVLRMAFMYLKDYHLAEDVFQEVFIKVFHKYNSFRMDSSEKTWLMRITINQCKDLLRKNWMNKVRPIEEHELVNMKDEGEDFLDKVDNYALFESILTLDEKYKDVIILYYYQGYAISEIADLLETTTGTVSSLLSRARSKLKELLIHERWLEDD